MRDVGFFTYAKANHGLEVCYPSRPPHTWNSPQDTKKYPMSFKIPQDSVQSREERNRWSRKTNDYQLALVFEPTFFSASINELAASVAGLPFMAELFEHGVMVTRYNLVTPGGDDSLHVMVASTELDIFPPKIGQLNGDLFFFWEENGLMRRAHTTFDRILSSCTSMERVVGHCEKCLETPQDCFNVRFEKWIDQQEHSARIRAILDNEATIHKMNSDDLAEFLGEFGKHPAWEYTKPGTTGDSFAPGLRNVCDHQMWRIDELHDERRERSQKAAETKKHLKICHDECVLYDHCKWIQGKYRRGAFHCQDPAATYKYPHRPGTGPYTAEMLKTAQTNMLESANAVWLPRKHISLIVANSGLQTRLLGPKLRLVGLQPDMKTVKFREQYTPYTEHSLTFEDAVDVCRLPFWYAGRYLDSGFREPAVELSDYELMLYFEICQQDALGTYNYYCGSCTPLIMDIDWRPGYGGRDSWKRGSGSFGVTGHAGWQMGIGAIADVERVFQDFPKIFRYLN
jgi:hypothetical protein